MMINSKKVLWNFIKAENLKVRSIMTVKYRYRLFGGGSISTPKPKLIMPPFFPLNRLKN